MRDIAGRRPGPYINFIENYINIFYSNIRYYLNISIFLRLFRFKIIYNNNIFYFWYSFEIYYYYLNRNRLLIYI